MILNEMHLFLSETCCCCNQIGTLNFDRSKVNKGIKKSSEREKPREYLKFLCFYASKMNDYPWQHASMQQWDRIENHRFNSFCGLSVTIRKWCINLLARTNDEKGKKEIHSVKIIICSFLIVKIMTVYVVLVFDCRRSWFWPNSSVCVNNSDNSKCVYVHFQASLSLSHELATIYYIWRLMSRRTPNTNHANNL